MDRKVWTGKCGQDEERAMRRGDAARKGKRCAPTRSTTAGCGVTGAGRGRTCEGETTTKKNSVAGLRLRRRDEGETVQVGQTERRETEKTVKEEKVADRRQTEKQTDIRTGTGQGRER